MKKFYLLPAIALLMLGASCSDDNEVRPVPNDPIVSVPPVADNVTITYPTQVGDYVAEKGANSSSYRFFFSNQQEIVFEIDASNMAAVMAVVKKIGGTAKDVVIPATISAPLAGSTEPTEITVAGLDLYVNAVENCVETITIPGTANKMKGTASYSSASPDHLRTQVERCPSVKAIYLANDYPGYCSLEGAIYTSDFSALVAVPMAKTGTFTIAETVSEVQNRAFFKCNKLDAITFPASIEKIGNEAVLHTTNLLLINMLPAIAPKAAADAFGYYAHIGVLRIPAGSKAAYTFERPNVEEPIEPKQPELDASDEEWDNYDLEMEKYDEDLKAYNEAMSNYDSHAAYGFFNDIQEVNFK